MFVFEMLPSVHTKTIQDDAIHKKGPHLSEVLGQKNVCPSSLFLLPVFAVPWRSFWKAEHVASLMFLSTLCGWSHGGPFDYSGIIFWLQFNMVLLRERAMEFPSSALCEREWTNYMRHFLCPTLKSRGVPHIFYQLKFHIFLSKTCCVW